MKPEIIYLVSRIKKEIKELIKQIDCVDIKYSQFMLVKCKKKLEQINSLLNLINLHSFQ